jgi:hypothetical protein
MRVCDLLSTRTLSLDTLRVDFIDKNTWLVVGRGELKSHRRIFLNATKHTLWRKTKF